MAAPVINNVLLPIFCVLVLPDAPDSTTGVIVRVSGSGGGKFMSPDVQTEEYPDTHTHVLFVKEMSTEVNIDSVEYLAMHSNAVVGLIP